MNIKIRKIRNEPSYNFEVVIEEENSSTRHFVSMSKNFYKDLETEKAPWKVIREIFYFLLDRESKEQILSEFDVTIVSYYFPEFKQELRKMLNNE